MYGKGDTEVSIREITDTYSVKVIFFTSFKNRD